MPSPQSSRNIIIVGIAAFLIIGGGALGFILTRDEGSGGRTSSMSFDGEFFLTKKECETATARSCSLEMIPPSVSAPQIPFPAGGGDRIAWTPVEGKGDSQSQSDGILSPPAPEEKNNTGEDGAPVLPSGETTFPQSGQDVPGNIPSGGTSGGGSIEVAASSHVPPVPSIRLAYKGRLYNGPLGEGCWPSLNQDGSLANLCWSAPAEVPTRTILIMAGENIDVRIVAESTPSSIEAVIVNASTNAHIATIAVPEALNSSFSANFPVGVYRATVKGTWSEGRISYSFLVEVR